MKTRRKIRADQRDDAVLELGAGMAFGEEVGDLFHLQRAFQRDGKIELPAEEQHPARRRRISSRSL